MSDRSDADGTVEVESCCARSSPGDHPRPAGLLPASVRSGLLSMRVLLDRPPATVWAWLTRPDLLAAWSPVVPDRELAAPGPASARETPDAAPLDAEVLEVFEPFRLVHRWGPDTLTWQLAPTGGGSQLQLVHAMSERDRYAETAAGWQLCLAVLADRLAGGSAARCVGADAARAAGWDALRDAYRETVVPNDADD